MIFQEKCFCCVLLIGQTFSDFLYFPWYWSICVLHLLVSQIVKSQILKSAFPVFRNDQKAKTKFKYLEKEKSFQGEIKNIIFKGISFAKNCLKPDSRSLRMLYQLKITLHNFFAGHYKKIKNHYFFLVGISAVFVWQQDNG